MSHIGIASERLGPGREVLRNEYHFRLIKADKRRDAIKVTLRFAQPANLRKGGQPLSLKVLKTVWPRARRFGMAGLMNEAGRGGSLRKTLKSFWELSGMVEKRQRSLTISRSGSKNTLRSVGLWSVFLKRFPIY